MTYKCGVTNLGREKRRVNKHLSEFCGFKEKGKVLIGLKRVIVAGGQNGKRSIRACIVKREKKIYMFWGHCLK